MKVRDKGCAKPFLKWAGGKSNLLPDLRELAPDCYTKYLEPFLGGGALFFDLCPNKAVLSDLNSELINCFRVVRDNLDTLVEKLKDMPVNKEFYYELRSLNIEKLDDVERAARLIYLNKTCYNGLYRVNRKGEFNTPYGKNTTVNVCNYEILQRASFALKGLKEIIVGDFEEILLKYAEKGDFVYLDPPYPSIGVYSDFKRYTKEFFDEIQHYRLAKVVEALNAKGCKFILSYANHKLAQQLYSQFRKIDVQAPRFINCQGSKRGNVSEILVTNIDRDESSFFSADKIHG